MKKLLCILVGAAMLAGCEQKDTTVTPPAENKTENNTTVVKESPAPATKTETNTTVNTNASPASKPSP